MKSSRVEELRMRKEREPSAGENNIRAEDEGRRSRAPSPFPSSATATLMMIIINALEEYITINYFRIRVFVR